MESVGPPCSGPSRRPRTPGISYVYATDWVRVQVGVRRGWWVGRPAAAASEDAKIIAVGSDEAEMLANLAEALIATSPTPTAAVDDDGVHFAPTPA